MSAGAIRVVLVDDEPLVRDGFRLIVDSQPDLMVVGEGYDGLSGLDVVRSAEPDVVLMDVQMPGLDGISATRQIVKEQLAARVVVLTTFEHDEYVHEALRSGASGFLLKRLTSADLLNAIRVVHAGDALVAPSVTRRLLDHYAVTAGRSRTAAAVPVVDLAERYRLTDREIDILHELAAGRSNAEIADALDVKEATVKTHVSSLLVKTGCRDRVQAVILAFDAGIVTPKPL